MSHFRNGIDGMFHVEQETADLLRKNNEIDPKCCADATIGRIARGVDATGGV